MARRCKSLLAQWSGLFPDRFFAFRLDQIVKVVREGQTKRAPIEKLADLVTGFFVPIITLLAILTWTIWLALGLGGALPQSYLDIPIGGWREF